jgi:UDP-N-acetylglucosamine transferase subunit ALG13
MTQAVKTADIIIAHGGVGTFLLCQRLGKPPILFPRVSRLREHVDDHQIEFTKTMMRRRMALAAFDEEGLWKAYRDYQSLSADLVMDVATDIRSGLSGHLNLILSQLMARRRHQ